MRSTDRTALRVVVIQFRCNYVCLLRSLINSANIGKDAFKLNNFICCFREVMQALLSLTGPAGSAINNKCSPGSNQVLHGLTSCTSADLLSVMQRHRYVCTRMTVWNAPIYRMINWLWRLLTSIFYNQWRVTGNSGPPAKICGGPPPPAHRLITRPGRPTPRPARPPSSITSRSPRRPPSRPLPWQLTPLFTTCFARWRKHVGDNVFLSTCDARPRNDVKASVNFTTCVARGRNDVGHNVFFPTCDARPRNDVGPTMLVTWVRLYLSW